jgi:hypothetical protein
LHVLLVQLHADEDQTGLGQGAVEDLMRRIDFVEERGADQYGAVRREGKRARMDRWGPVLLRGGGNFPENSGKSRLRRWSPPCVGFMRTQA